MPNVADKRHTWSGLILVTAKRTFSRSEKRETGERWRNVVKHEHRLQEVELKEGNYFEGEISFFGFECVRPCPLILLLKLDWQTALLLKCSGFSPENWFLVHSPAGPMTMTTLWRLWDPSEASQSLNFSQIIYNIELMPHSKGNAPLYKTQPVSLFVERISAYCENHTKRKPEFCCQNDSFSMVKHVVRVGTTGL
jgi:hypothetical protein